MTANMLARRLVISLLRTIAALSLSLSLIACGFVSAEVSGDGGSVKLDEQENSSGEETVEVSGFTDRSISPRKRSANLEPITLDAKQSEFATLAEAQEQADFELLLPMSLPNGFDFRRGWISEFAIESPPPPVAIMVFANEHDSFTLVQGREDSLVVPLPSRDAVRDDAPRGEVEIQGVPAEWLRGAYVTQHPGDPSDMDDMRWDESQLQLYWEKDGFKYSLESRSLDLSELVKIANALE